MSRFADDSPARIEKLVEKISASPIDAPPIDRGLPRLAEVLLRKKRRLSSTGKVLRPWEDFAAQLDSTFPGWPEIAAALILSDSGEEVQPPAQIAAGLLALRPLTFCEPLCQALIDPVKPYHRELAALALLGTDRAEVRVAYRRAFDELAGRRFEADSANCRAVWLIFVRLAQEKSLSYKELRSLALESDLFQPEGRPRLYGKAGRQACFHKKGFALHPCLDRSGLSQQPEFRRLYSMLAAEILPSINEARSWYWLRWIRCFPGVDYLFEALDCLERKPNHTYALFIARWTQELREEEALLAERLADYNPLTLMIASLLRPHQDELFGQALGSPLHSQALQWLRLPCSKAADKEQIIREVIIPWAQEYCGLFTDALGALCALKVPFEESSLENNEELTEIDRVQGFLSLHLLAHFFNLTDNLLLLQGLLGRNLGRVIESAKAGRCAAIRALGMVENISEEGLRLLLSLSREGGEAVRRAARWSLKKAAARHGLGSVEALADKLDLAAAWVDGGLADSPSRVWWDIAGHRVKLSLAQGKVEVSAWGPGRKKQIPAKVRAHPLFAEVQTSRKALAQTYSIFRERLEESMLCGWYFSGEQFRFLFTNPAFRSLTERLVLSFDGKTRLLENQAPQEIEKLLTETKQVRVIHPIELCAAGGLETWQQTLADRHISQPFKQCFREIYLLEEKERSQVHCTRFSAQPILGRKAYALLKRRGYSPCKGDAYRDWFSDRIRAHFIWASEGENLWRHVVGAKQSLPVMSGGIYFARLEEKTRGRSRQILTLKEVDPVVFSETLRDADLAVSSAAAGEEGFSSRQTVEIRAVLVKNLARLLNLPGIRVDAGSSQAHIQGKRASYRIHLGSGRVLVEPSGKHISLPSTSGCDAPFQAEEKMDSRTLAILETVAALSFDGEISDPDFLAALAAL